MNSNNLTPCHHMRASSALTCFRRVRPLQRENSVRLTSPRACSCQGRILRAGSPRVNFSRPRSPQDSTQRQTSSKVNYPRVRSQSGSYQRVRSPRAQSPCKQFPPVSSALISRKMGFVVDKVSEDSFYENLLLGLSKVLDKSPCVSKLSLKRLSGVRQVDIRAWEHNNGVILPEDLRSFYSSTNGFVFTYEFSYDYQTVNDDDKDFRLGIIQVNSINELIRIFGYETKNTAQVECTGKKYCLSLSRESKVFELVNVDENAKVVLVYPTTYSVPSIWFYTGQMTFSFLAEDFTTYFRMCIAHLGIPCWQYVFSKEGLPEWTREMFNIIAPGVLREDKNLTEIHSYKYTIEHLNKIDPNIFSITQSCANLNLERPSNARPVENKMKDKGKCKVPPKRAPSGKSKKVYS